ncbi:hypothetical protein WG922_21605 [Ramlibacter sp. AN1015]|uniref:hypothetical protein n=1 Tax=Ramlibacter sp. AN1015 TaxID=3133428 RepID=UPI0030C50C65
MKLVAVPSTHIDRAWAEGASCLARACDASGGEIEGPQLKMILARGERTLIRMDCEGQAVGWGVVRVDQLPNMRVLFVTDLVAPHGHFERFFSELKNLAVTHGCSRIRCAAKPAQARLYSMKCGFKPVYTIQEVEV